MQAGTGHTTRLQQQPLAFDLDAHGAALLNATTHEVVESSVTCAGVTHPFIRDHTHCRLKHVSCCDGEGAIVRHSVAPLLARGEDEANSRPRVLRLVDHFFGTKDIAVRAERSAYAERECTDVIENAYTFGFLLDSVYGHFLGETLPMLFATIVLHEGEAAIAANARNRTLLHAFTAPPATVRIEPMMSLLRVFSAKPVRSLEDVRWRSPRRACFRSLVLGNDNGMVFSLTSGGASYSEQQDVGIERWHNNADASMRHTHASTPMHAGTDGSHKRRQARTGESGARMHARTHAQAEPALQL
jgi:hypothetical protein